MKKNENGFSVVEILILVVIVGVIGAIGWLVWQSRLSTTGDNGSSKSSQDSQTDSSTNQDQQEPNTDDKKQPATNTAKDGNFSSEVTLLNKKTTLVSFKYNKTWEFVGDDGKKLTFTNSDDVSIILSYSEGGSAPTVPEKVTTGSNKYRKFTWGGDDIRYIRYFPGHESGDFNKDGIQYISIQGSPSLTGNADHEAELLLDTLEY